MAVNYSGICFITLALEEELSADLSYLLIVSNTVDNAGKSCRRGRLSAVDLLVPTSLDQLLI
jgi:hypothetical protein